MNSPLTHERRIFRRYSAELSGALLLYTVLLIVSLKLGLPMSPSRGRTLFLVSPMLPFLLAVWAVARQIRRVDEYMRLQVLEGIAIAAAITAGWTFTYGFLENAGFPRLSMFTVWPVMGAVWGIVTLIRCAAQR